MREAVVQLAERRGTVAIVDGRHQVTGVVTAGDLTRLMERERDFMEVPVDAIMTRTPKLARDVELGSAVVFRMQKHGIMAMPVVDDEGRLVGMVHLHDLMRAGVV
jgi:arabinose-5-phosphate isomerase